MTKRTLKAKRSAAARKGKTPWGGAHTREQLKERYAIAARKGWETRRENLERRAFEESMRSIKAGPRLAAKVRRWWQRATGWLR